MRRKPAPAFGKREARLIAVELANELERLGFFRQPEQSLPPSVSATDSGPVSASGNTRESLSFCATPGYVTEQDERNRLAGIALHRVSQEVDPNGRWAAETYAPKKPNTGEIANELKREGARIDEALRRAEARTEAGGGVFANAIDLSDEEEYRAWLGHFLARRADSSRWAVIGATSFALLLLAACVWILVR